MAAIFRGREFRTNGPRVGVGEVILLSVPYIMMGPLLRPTFIFRILRALRRFVCQMCQGVDFEGEEGGGVCVGC